MAAISLRSQSLLRSAAGLLICAATWTALETEVRAQATDAWVEGQGYVQGVNPIRGHYYHKDKAGFFSDRHVEAYRIRENRLLDIQHRHVYHTAPVGPWYRDTYYHRWNRRFHIYRGGHTWSPDDCLW